MNYRDPNNWRYRWGEHVSGVYSATNDPVEGWLLYVQEREDGDGRWCPRIIE
jgi:hypothetical protein